MRKVATVVLAAIVALGGGVASAATTPKVSVFGAQITGTQNVAKAKDRNIAACRAIVLEVYETRDYRGTAVERRYLGQEDDHRVALIFTAIRRHQPITPVLDKVCGR